MEVSAHCQCYKSLVLPKLPPHAAHAALSHVVAFRQRSSSINSTSPQLLRLQRQRQPLLLSIKPKSKNHRTIYAASSSSSVQTPPDKWLLEPVGTYMSHYFLISYVVNLCRKSTQLYIRILKLVNFNRAQYICAYVLQFRHLLRSVSC